MFLTVTVNRRLSENSAKKAEEICSALELIEENLLELSPQALLRAQKVGRNWRDTINGSGQLLRELGLVDPVPDQAFYYSSLPSNYERYDV